MLEVLVLGIGALVVQRIVHNYKVMDILDQHR